MMEFLIALLPVMLAFLGFTQMCFAGIAKLAVRHAAALVTRAAVVVIEEADGIPGAPANIYGGFPAGGLEVDKPKSSGGGAPSDAQQQVSGMASAAAQSDSTQRTLDGLLGSTDRTSTRIKQIRTAAYWPLLAISPNLFDDGFNLASNLSNGDLFPKLKVKDAIGKSNAARLLGALLYNLGAVAVTFPRSPDSLPGEFSPNELVTARVTYLFRCQVPIASLLMCSSGWAMMFGDAWVDPLTMRDIANAVGDVPHNISDLPQWADEWRRVKAVRDMRQRRIDAFKGHESEFEQVEWPFMTDLLLAMPGARYMVLYADAQLPLQSANYYPRVNNSDMQKLWAAQAKKSKSSTKLPNIRAMLKPVQTGLTKVENAASTVADKVQAQIDAVKRAGTSTLAALQTNGDDLLGDLQSTRDQYLGQLIDTGNGYIDDVRQAASPTVDAVKAAGNQVSKTVDVLKNGAQGYASQALGGVVSGAQNVKQTASSLGRDIASQANGYASQLEQQGAQDAKSLQSAANGAASDLVNGAKGYAKDAQQTASDLAHQIKSTGAGYASDARALGKQYGDELKSAGKAYQQDIHDVANGGQATATQYLQNGQDALQSGAGAAQDAVGGVANQGSQLLQGAANGGAKAGKAARSAAHGASDALENLRATDALNKPSASNPGGLNPDEF